MSVALDVVAEYVAGFADGDPERMARVRSAEFSLDWVHGDAFGSSPMTREAAESFWPAWLAAFSELDLEVTRTIAAEQLVVTQWTFRGLHSAPLGPPVFETPREPTGRSIEFRGASFYDVEGGAIRRDTTYMDLATLLVELGPDQ